MDPLLHLKMYPRFWFEGHQSVNNREAGGRVMSFNGLSQGTSTNQQFSFAPSNYCTVIDWRNVDKIAINWSTFWPLHNSTIWLDKIRRDWRLTQGMISYTSRWKPTSMFDVADSLSVSSRIWLWLCLHLPVYLELFGILHLLISCHLACAQCGEKFTATDTPHIKFQFLSQHAYSTECHSYGDHHFEQSGRKRRRRRS